MTSLVTSLTIDCGDPRAVAEFWCTALGYVVDEVDDEGAMIVDPTGRHWPILFLAVPDTKSTKNRSHLDLSPPTTMAAEVDRLITAGAALVRRVDEHGSYWTVMTDPDGNEFCVLRGPGDDPPKPRPA